MSVQQQPSPFPSNQHLRAYAVVSGIVIALSLVVSIFVFPGAARENALVHERVKAEASSEPWLLCVDPLLHADPMLHGVSHLKSSRTDRGSRYVLLSKHAYAKDNKVYECEVSSTGEFIGGRFGR